MPATDFILKYNGQSQTLAAWGISDCQFESNDFAADTVTFTVDGRPLDAADLFTYGSTVEIFFPDGVTRWFYGRVEPWERNGSGPSLSHFGRLVGPWFYLERVYKARFRIAVSNFPFAGQGTPNYVTVTTPRVILNIGQAANANGYDTWTTGQQLADVVNYFNSLGFPLQLGLVAPWSSPFSSQQQGITGAEVIRMMFQREPDFTCIWDYATTPPTIHFLKSSNLNLAPGLTGAQQAGLIVPSQTINLAALTQDEIKIKPRPDLQRSYVHLYYETTQVTNGSQYLLVNEDVYPNPQPTDEQSLTTGIDMVINLQGSSQNIQTQTCEFTSQPFDPTNINQWIAWKASLAAEDVVAATVLTADNTDDPVNHPGPTITTRDDEQLPFNAINAFEITDGSWAPWMQTAQNLQVGAQKVRCSAWLRVYKKRGVDGKQHTDYIPVHADFVATSFNTGGAPENFFVNTTNVTSVSEPIPFGLAKSMYLAWQSLSLEGTLSKTEQVLTSTISRGFCLNFLSASQPQWANALACVRHVSGSIDRGVTKIEFGARLRIAGLDILNYIRSTRLRVTGVNIAYFFGGPLGGSGGNQIQHPQKHHPRSVEHGSSHSAVHVVAGKANPQANTDPAVQTDGNTGITTWSPPVPAGAAPGSATGRAVIDPSKLMGSDNKWHTMALQEVIVCKPDGTQWTAIGWFSEFYKAPGQS